MNKNKIDSLKKLRKTLNLMQKEMAKEIGVSISYYCKIEKGFKNPSYVFLLKLKKKYPEVNIDEMFFKKMMEHKSISE